LDSYPPQADGGSIPPRATNDERAALAAFFMFTVYVLYSPTFRKTYTGFTSSLAKRLESHNSFATKGYTLKYRPWIVLHTEEFAIKKDAIIRERELKAGKGREFIKKVIQEKFP
jgi:putative endonuclease